MSVCVCVYMCVCVCVCAYAWCRYEEFIENSGKLNSLENYSQLQERAKAIGYEISKVVFRGYHATSRLQVSSHIKKMLGFV